FPWGEDDTSVGDLLTRLAREHGAHLYCRFGERRYTASEIETTANRLANALLGRGIIAGDRVGVMLDHHPVHAVVFFALAKLGAVTVPLNPHLRGVGLEHLLRDGDLASLIVEGRLADTLGMILQATPVRRVIWHDRPAGVTGDELGDLLVHP